MNCLNGSNLQRLTLCRKQHCIDTAIRYISPLIHSILHRKHFNYFKNLQESLNRPISVSDFALEIPLKEQTRYLQTITDSQEISPEMKKLHKQYTEDRTDG